MLNKGMLDILKEKAQQSLDSLKKETLQVQSKINNNIVEPSSKTGKDDLVNNAAVNKAARLLIENSTEQAEKLIYKFFHPYDVFEIFDTVYAQELIQELSAKINENDNPDTYRCELTVLYLNNSSLARAEETVNAIENPVEKKRLAAVVAISKLNDQTLLQIYDRYRDFILSQRVYKLYRRYASLFIEKKKYQNAKEMLERCCSHNPTSIKDNRDLLLCYEQSNEYQSAELQRTIIRILS